MIPLIIMGGILTGWFTPTEAGMIASVYILVVLIPLLNRGHITNLPRDFVYTGLLYSCRWRWLRPPRRSAGCSPICAGRTSSPAGSSWSPAHDGRIIMLLLVLLFIVIGDFMDAVPAIIIFMPIVIKLNELGDIKPLHMGVVLITTLVFGLITPPYGLSLLVASKFIGVRFSAAMYASLPIYVVFFFTIAFTVFFPEVVLYLPKLLLPEFGRLLQEPDGRRLHLPAVDSRSGHRPRLLRCHHSSPARRRGGVRPAGKLHRFKEKRHEEKGLRRWRTGRSACSM